MPSFDVSLEESAEPNVNGVAAADNDGNGWEEDSEVEGCIGGKVGAPGGILASALLGSENANPDAFESAGVLDTGVNPPEGLAVLEDKPEVLMGKPAKLVGGAGIDVGNDDEEPPEPNDEDAGLVVAGNAPLVAGLGSDDLESYSFWTDTRCVLYCSNKFAISENGSVFMALLIASSKDALRPRREV